MAFAIIVGKVSPFITQLKTDLLQKVNRTQINLLCSSSTVCRYLRMWVGLSNRHPVTELIDVVMLQLEYESPHFVEYIQGSYRGWIPMLNGALINDDDEDRYRFN